jgi:predicted nuclease with TOPRIM domain
LRAKRLNDAEKATFAGIMTPTELLQTQNEELEAALVRLGFQLRLGGDHNGAMLRRRLLEIAEKLDEHVREEAQLSPRLDGSEHFIVRAISRSTRRQLENMEHRVRAFFGRWSTAEKIDARHAEFVQEGAMLVESLRRTLLGERANLFPLVASDTAR